MADADNYAAGVEFQFLDAKGTVANNPAQFAVVGNQAAYIAGSGVVVTTLRDDGRVRSQRLFVANGAEPAVAQNSYALPETADPEVRRDAFGYPTNSPITYEGSAAENDERQGEGKDAASTAQGKLKDRVRAFACLALAPNGRVLAVGETGYQPRVLLFSLAPNSSNRPFATIREHSFGVNHLCFSPDSKHLCSLGSISDGFLHVWKYSASAVASKASNKCSSLINELHWLDTAAPHGSIVTLGLRFLKVWNYEPAESKTLLKGRNILLGRYLDTNFQSAYSLGDDQLLLKGGPDFFVLKLGPEARLFPAAVDAEEPRGLVADSAAELLWYFDSETQSHSLPFEQIQVDESDPSPSVPSSPSKLSPSRASPSKSSPPKGLLNLSMAPQLADGGIVKASMFKDGIIYLTNDAKLMYYRSGISTTIVSPPISFLSGGKKCGSEAILFSKSGEVRALEESGHSKLVTFHDVLQVEGMTNELTAVEKSGSTVVLGDKYGSLTIMDLETGSVELQMKAHSSAVNDIVYFEVDNTAVVCSISRDRMIQLYFKNEGKWDLFGTIPVHTGNLLAVKYAAPYLFVCSADRSVSVHELAKPEGGSLEVVQRKIISLKNTPLAMGISDSDVLISTNDRSLFVFDRKTLQSKRSLKVHDEKSHQALCFERFAFLSSEIVVAYSSDKSLRVFNAISGKILGCSWGHLEAVIGLFYHDGILQSLGVDGCLFTWKLAAPREEPVTTQNSPASSLSEPEMSPLLSKISRKILPTHPTQLSPKRASFPSPDYPIAEPESPTPRLTSATLKRLEAKRNSELDSSQKLGTPTKIGSPSRQTSPTKSSTFARGTSPPKYTSPTRKTHTSLRNDSVAMAKKRESVLLPPPNTHSEDSMERATAYIAMVKSILQKGLLSEKNKASLKTDIDELQSLLGVDSGTLLESYSDKLVKLVEAKLSKLDTQ